MCAVLLRHLVGFVLSSAWVVHVVFVALTVAVVFVFLRHDRFGY